MADTRKPIDAPDSLHPETDVSLPVASPELTQLYNDYTAVQTTIQQKLGTPPPEAGLSELPEIVVHSGDLVVAAPGHVYDVQSGGRLISDTEPNQSTQPIGILVEQGGVADLQRADATIFVDVQAGGVVHTDGQATAQVHRGGTLHGDVGVAMVDPPDAAGKVQIGNGLIINGDQLQNAQAAGYAAPENILQNDGRFQTVDPGTQVIVVDGQTDKPNQPDYSTDTIALVEAGTAAIVTNRGTAMAEVGSNVAVIQGGATNFEAGSYGYVDNGGTGYVEKDASVYAAIGANIQLDGGTIYIPNDALAHRFHGTPQVVSDVHGGNYNGVNVDGSGNIVYISTKDLAHVPEPLKDAILHPGLQDDYTGSKQPGLGSPSPTASHP